VLLLNGRSWIPKRKRKKAFRQDGEIKLSDRKESVHIKGEKRTEYKQNRRMKERMGTGRQQRAFIQKRKGNYI
jgi:hypothetical protein